jgi:hypothetical protein
MQPIKDAFVYAIKQNNLELMQKFSLAIALSISNDLKVIDPKKRPEIPSKEFTTKISDSIFNSLVAIGNFGNDEIFSTFMAPFLDESMGSRERPELYPIFNQVIENLFQQNSVEFESDFLNMELEKGNITFEPRSRMVYLIGSSEFVLVDGDKKKHKDKITSQLKREGYIFKDDGYYK